jgi:hypothetical protein
VVVVKWIAEPEPEAYPEREWIVVERIVIPGIEGVVVERIPPVGIPMHAGVITVEIPAVVVRPIDLIVVVTIAIVLLAYDRRIAVALDFNDVWATLLIYGGELRVAACQTENEKSRGKRKKGL